MILTKACFYMLKRWDAFTRFLGRWQDLPQQQRRRARAAGCIPLGRKAWLFCGSDRGGQRAAIIYTLIQTAKLNDVDPQAWLADVLARIADLPATRLDQLLPVELDAENRSDSPSKPGYRPVGIKLRPSPDGY